MKAKTWFVLYLVCVLLLTGTIAFITIRVDPYIHYHLPLTDKLYYLIENQRSVNNGIIRHFDYDALITGTSMTENFKTSELDALFGTHSIKVPFSGGSFKEINDNIAVAIDAQPKLRMVVRGLDLSKLADRSDTMRFDLGQYPEYLYDSSIFNDAEYLFNRDLLFNIIYAMYDAVSRGQPSGILSFDEYSSWSSQYDYGKDSVLAGLQAAPVQPGKPVHLSEQEMETMLENVHLNVCQLALEHPEIEFYYFLSPYSAAWWKTQYESGEIYKQLELQEAAINEILKCGNIRLFSFSDQDFCADLNNYKDFSHYGEWINSYILLCMRHDMYRLSPENAADHIQSLREIYLNFDYASLFLQEDYPDDEQAARLLEERIDDLLSSPGMVA